MYWTNPVDEANVAHTKFFGAKTTRRPTLSIRVMV
ncbi:unnamed protein product [Ixodes persulcatus]